MEKGKESLNGKSPGNKLREIVAEETERVIRAHNKEIMQAAKERLEALGYIFEEADGGLHE